MTTLKNRTIWTLWILSLVMSGQLLLDLAGNVAWAKTTGAILGIVAVGLATCAGRLTYLAMSRAKDSK